MALLRLEQASLAFGDHALLDHCDWAIQPGLRIALIGRNGAGKSTLLKLLDGRILPDSGQIWRSADLKVAMLDQELPEADDRTVFDVVVGGLGNVKQLLDRYAELSAQEDYESGMQELEALQHQIEAVDGWHMEQRVERILTRLKLPRLRKMSELSGGWRRRVALGQALVGEPDILLLDEPTNHLDITAIQWLEEQLLEFSGTLIFITHDRSFLKRVANVIAELDRGRLFPWEGNYDSFLAYRERVLADEERHNALFDKKLAQEEVWIRQGIKARRTRNEGRVRALKALREERVARRERQGKASFSVETADRSGKRVVEAKGISHQYNGQFLVKDLDVTILRGDRIGLIGPNGVGKTTLLKLLLGDLEPQIGQIERGTNLSVAYFDQMREQLDPEKTVIDNVAEGRESIEINGRQRHLISYLGDFLFTPGRTRSKVKSLSGGERNRLLLAKLFTKPANLLVLDEPTNDLDLETLELLEEVLCEYKGTLLIVSHDRAFLDNVVTSTLVFEGQGKIGEYIGGYADWVRLGGRLLDASVPDEEVPDSEPSVTAAPKAEPAKATPAPPVRKKLSYKLQRELDELPKKLELLEANISAVEAETSAADFYLQDHTKTASVIAQLEALHQEHEGLMERWLELEALQEG